MATDYSKMNKDELLKAATKKEIEGRSSMNKDELIKALTAASAPTEPEDTRTGWS